MQLVPNTRVGSYEVVGLLGLGGMGEVYRARDTRLNRDVALKILPESFALDPDRIARFTREAHVLASLNHPNIAAIYGIEESNGVRALVLELVEGPTLADRIAEGALPLDEALPIAQQIVAALEVAHELGIIHRDLKPANIKVRPDGTVKVLDFGLAKALEPAAGAAQAPSLTESPTITTPAMTLAGVILGTAAYMSPEQARGRPADKRSDVWALGCVLYEMLTGRQAFAGADVSDMLAAVLRSEPDWSAVPPSVPPILLVFLKRCLRKDPKQRIPDIGTIRLALDGSFDLDVQRSPAATRPPGGSPWRRAVPWIVALLLAGLTVGLVVYDLRPVPPAHVSRLVIPTPPEAPVVGSLASQVAISRDGSRVVYRTQREKANEADSVLYVHDVGTLDVRLLPGTEGAVQPFFSPDGESVAYFDLRDRRLKRIGVRGGNPTTVCRWNGGQFSGGSWGSDDHIVFGTAAQGLQRVPAGGGEPKALTTPDTAKGASHRWPEVLPNSAAVLFTVWYGTDERSHIAVLSVATGQVSEIAAGGTHPRFAHSGHLVYVTGGTLRAVGFDLVRLTVRGRSVPVQEGVNEGRTGAAQFALAENGSLVYARRGSPIVGQRTLVWVDRTGREEPVNLPARAYFNFRLSPDGTRVALDARDQENDIWIGHLLDGRLMRLTFDSGLNRMPIWTRDGTRIAFTSNRDGAEGISWQAADGSGSAERLSPPGAEQGPLSFSRDGTRLVFITPLDGSQDIGALTLTGERRTEVLLNTKYMETNGEVSPDGDWLAYESNESTVDEIYVRPFPDVNTSRRQVSAGGGTHPLWSRDGRELFYFVPPDTIMAVPVQPGKELRFGRPSAVLKAPPAAALGGRHYDVSLDGNQFLLLKDVQDTNAREAPQLVLVQHWAEELKRLVPSK